jgi:hypothetical protein
MSTWTIAGIALGPNGPVNGATINLWKAQRFVTAPAYNAAAPAGTADAGPVTSGTAYGGPGCYEIAAPTNESYYVATTYAGNTSWVLVNDINFTDTFATTVASGSTGLTLAQIVTATSLDVATTAGANSTGRIYVTTSGGQAVLSYTSVTGGATPSFNGIAVVSGTTSWTVTTGNAVVSAQQIATLNQTVDDGVGDASFVGAIAVTGGAASTPTFVSGTAQQLNATKNGVLYMDITTAASLTIAIGPTSSATTVLQTSIVSALGLTHVHVPAGWYVKLTGTMADITFTFITGI